MDKGGGVLSKEISVVSVGGGGYEEIIWFFNLVDYVNWPP